MVSINLDKAKAVAHDMRRAARSAVLEPLDAQINYAIADPAKVADVEAERQAIRETYAAMQDAINAALDPDGIKAALAYPNDGKLYRWDEGSLAWVEVPPSKV